MPVENEVLKMQTCLLHRAREKDLSSTSEMSSGPEEVQLLRHAIACRWRRLRMRKRTLEAQVTAAMGEIRSVERSMRRNTQHTRGLRQKDGH